MSEKTNEKINRVSEAGYNRELTKLFDIVGLIFPVTLRLSYTLFISFLEILSKVNPQINASLTNQF